MKKVTKNLLLLWLLALVASSLVGYFGTRQPPPPLVPGKDISTGTFFQLYLYQEWVGGAVPIFVFAAGISLAKLLSVAAAKTKYLFLWLLGVLSVIPVCYFLLRLFVLIHLGPLGWLWVNIIRKSFWPTLLLAAAILMAKLVFRAVQTAFVGEKKYMYVWLSGLAAVGLLGYVGPFGKGQGEFLVAITYRLGYEPRSILTVWFWLTWLAAVVLTIVKLVSGAVPKHSLAAQRVPFEHGQSFSQGRDEPKRVSSFAYALGKRKL